MCLVLIINNNNIKLNTNKIFNTLRNNSFTLFCNLLLWNYISQDRRIEHILFYSLFSSVAQSCATLCNPMNRSTPGLPVHHLLPPIPPSITIALLKTLLHFYLHLYSCPRSHKCDLDLMELTICYDLNCVPHPKFLFWSSNSPMTDCIWR